MKQFNLRITDHDVEEELTIAIDDEEEKDLWDIVEETAREWVMLGEYDPMGEVVNVLCSVEDSDGEFVGEMELDVIFPTDEDYAAKVSGVPQCEHKWERKGGLSVNPGVFSLGDTIVIHEECEYCGSAKDILWKDGNVVKVAFTPPISLF